MTDIEQLKTKSLCYQCVDEPFLRDEMGREGRRRTCSYCGRTAKCHSIEAVADRVEEVFAVHYIRTSDQPNSWQQTILSDRESDYDWERSGDPVVQAILNAAQIPEAAAEDVQAVLEDRHSDFDSDAMSVETEFSSESFYEERRTSDRAWQEEWYEFERGLKTEARFFSRSASAHLASIFDGIDRMSAHGGRPLVVEAGPGLPIGAFYRARAFQSDERLEEALCRPDLHLGSPPARLSASGRMNAKGISVFYGANEPHVAIAEVRPPVGSQVAVARFDIVRPLRLLDLTALGAVAERGSVFDPGFADRLERAMFLRSLSQRITRPVMPDDEAFEYLATQALADFLATDERLLIDGIVFPSVQAAGAVLNVVLFHKAARVMTLDISDGTTFSARTGQFFEDGWETDYSVFEQPPRQTGSEPDDDDIWPRFSPLVGDTRRSSDPDGREAALRIDLESLRVHQVDRVEMHTTDYSVHRYRSRSPE